MLNFELEKQNKNKEIDKFNEVLKEKNKGYIKKPYELDLFDRIEKIKSIDERYDLENNAYISFSGGKDSTVLHYLIDLALPNNNIPRLFMNTGIEYNDLRKFVKELSLTDKRIIMVNSNVNIPKMLNEYGYPFKSKQHSHNVSIYQNNREAVDKIVDVIDNNKPYKIGIFNLEEDNRIYNDYYFEHGGTIKEAELNLHYKLKNKTPISYEIRNGNALTDYDYISNLPKGTKTLTKYIYGVRERERELYSTQQYAVPKALRYNFSQEFTLKCSDKCCYKLKKDVARKWELENNRPITLTGMRKAEGGNRNNINCIVTDGDKLTKFHPLAVCNDEFVEEFIKQNSIKLCKLYYPPFNFRRTGCKGCPFALDLQAQLDLMSEHLPIDYKQCESIWGKVYEEYRRKNYRLKSQMSIFDL